MPSTNQQGDDTEEYATTAERMIAEKPKRVILSIRPMTEDNAREFLGAANASGDDELIEHFVECVQRLKED